LRHRASLPVPHSAKPRRTQLRREATPGRDVVKRQPSNLPPRWYRKGADAGEPIATVDLGLLYLRGKCVERDYAEARRLFEQGAALGGAAAMNGMGVIYNEGEGMPRNARVARQRYEKAAIFGNPEA